MTTPTQIFYGHPKDRSYEAWKKFMDAMASKLAPGLKDDLTEEEDRRYWREFWKKVDSKK